MLLTALAALAASTPTITLVPDGPLGGPTPNVGFNLDASLPGGEEFVLRLPVPDPNYRGRLVVWPRVEETCGAAPSEGRQVHTLALSASADGKSLQATVPRLQVGQAFCMTVALAHPFGASDWAPLAAMLADDVVGAQGSDCTPAGLLQPLSDAMARRLGAWEVAPESVGAATREALLQYGTPTNIAACAERVRLEAQYSAETRILERPPAGVDVSALRTTHTLTRTALDTAALAVEAALANALAVPTVSARLVVKPKESTATFGRAGGIETPADANYVSLQTGVAVGYPVGVEGADVWGIPYVGASIYAVPVDRDIDMDELVGPVFLQRVSLMVGLALNGTTLAIPDRTVLPGWGTTTPVFGASLRLTNNLNLTAGSAIYRLQDPSPASSHIVYRLAPFAAFSLDADIVKLISDAF